MRFEFRDQPLGFAAFREDRVEGSEKHCFVETLGIAPVAFGETHAGNAQNFGRDLAQAPPVDRRRKAEARNIIAQVFPRLGAPVLDEIEGRVERGRR